MNEFLGRLDRIHPYPAKYPLSFALETIKAHSCLGDVVYDPFLGSGTSVLAASLLGRVGYGTDINPIAILVSRFKQLQLSSEEITELYRFINSFTTTYQDKLRGDIQLYDYPSIDHWFCLNAKLVLSLLRSEIRQLNNNRLELFANVVFSSIVNTLSNQESDTRYAAIVKNIEIKSSIELFIRKFLTAIDLVNKISKCKRLSCLDNIYLMDSQRCYEILPKNKVNLIITSPPYPNTYDYYLYHKHRMLWLGMDYKPAMHQEIGSRREFSSLKAPKEKFNSDMEKILTSATQMLVDNGKLILVMGDGRIRGETYEAKENMESICRTLGFRLVDYSFTLLDETSKAFMKAGRTKGKKEHVLVFSR